MTTSIRYLLFAALSLLPAGSFCQLAPVDTLESRAMNQLIAFPQEKIYVQTDKPYYIGGEDIWFRIHLVNASLHQPSDLSRYVYGELIAPVDTIVSRIKIRPDSLGCFHGSFKLAEELSEGDYQLRFYTRFMENQGEDFFFRKKIKIGDPLSASYSTEATFKKDEKRKEVEVELKFLENNTKRLILPENIKIKLASKYLEVKPGNDSIARFTMKDQTEVNHLHVEYDYGRKFHKQFIPLVYETSDFDVSFHPEGGDLLAGECCQMAFKALNTNGYGEDITGHVINETGDTLTNFHSLHQGMGSFLMCSGGGKYYAICRNVHGIEKRFELPASKPNSFALQASWQKERLFVKVLKSEGFQPADSLYLFVHSRGIPVSLMSWDFSQEYIQLDRQDMPSGVIQLILADRNLTPISERLVFNFNERDIASSSFSTNRTSYGNRELVKANIRLMDHDNNPLTGDFSLSVTDDRVVIPDTAMNICSYLLLSSDIKGYIENPSYYFGQGRETAGNLDLLIMTQGWKRYNYMKALKGEPEVPLIPAERSSSVTGSVKSGLFVNRLNAGIPVNILSKREDYVFFETVVTDENGRYKFDRFELPDSSQLVLQALTKKGGRGVELTVDKEVFPAITGLPLNAIKDKGKYELFEQYAETADRYFVTENGIRLIYLQEVVVRGHRPRSKSSRLASPMSTVINMDEFMAGDYQPKNIMGVLRSLGPKMNISGGMIRTSEGESPLILLDDMEVGSSTILFLDPHAIAEVIIMKKDEAKIVFGPKGRHGAYIVTSKKGDFGIRSVEYFNVKNIIPLGYQLTAEFYSPKYETAEQKNSAKSDLRTTIHWAPSVVTNENGDAEVSFYSADSQTAYSVVYEGVSSDGLPVYGKGKIDIKGKGH